MKKVIVIGGGAAGLMAAVSAIEYGSQVTILEKMPSIGRKLLITGKGRCNITNTADNQTFIKNMTGNGTFLYSAIHKFNQQDMIEFLARYGLVTKVERGGRVFPESDRAQDVVTVFRNALISLGAEIVTDVAVKKIMNTNGRAVGVITTKNVEYFADAVILATGGASYPTTGSSGDGYRMAEMLRHTIVPIKPSLVPLEVKENWIGELQGLSLKNVSATVCVGDKNIAEDFGEMLFTHYGLSGPIILSLSKKVSELLSTETDSDISIEINLKPALSEEQLDNRIQRDFEKFLRKQLKNSLSELLPAKMINVIINLSHIDPEKPIHQITKEERARLLRAITHLTFTIKGTRPISEAIVTAGGVQIKEINPSTMESKLIKDLYFAGEVIDIDGYTGGFNLQAAFSTGYVAGKNAAQE